MDNDLISRKAAIDAIEHMQIPIMRSAFEYEQFIFKGMCEALNAVKALPSAQPERKIELYGDESAIEILSELRSWFSCFDEKEGLAYHALSLAIRAIKANHTARSEQLEKCPIYGGVCLHPSDQCYECPRHAGAERKTGKWVDKSGGIDGAWNYCSVCGEQAIDLYDFCPHCGAKMDG